LILVLVLVLVAYVNVNQCATIAKNVDQSDQTAKIPSIIDYPLDQFLNRLSVASALNDFYRTLGVDNSKLMSYVDSPVSHFKQGLLHYLKQLEDENVLMSGALYLKDNSKETRVDFVFSIGNRSSEQTQWKIKMVLYTSDNQKLEYVSLFTGKDLLQKTPKGKHSVKIGKVPLIFESIPSFLFVNDKIMSNTGMEMAKTNEYIEEYWKRVNDPEMGYELIVSKKKSYERYYVEYVDTTGLKFSIKGLKIQKGHLDSSHFQYVKEYQKVWKHSLFLGIEDFF